MSIFFQVCFGVGLGYAVISFVLGQLLGGLTGGGADADASFDAGGDVNPGLDLDLDIDIDADISSAGLGIDVPSESGADSPSHGASSVSPFKPTVIAAFLGVFGGAGMIFLPRTGVYLAVTFAGLIGLAAGYAVFSFYAFLFSRQSTNAVARHSFIGAEASVSEFIPQGKYGKITYHANDNTYTAPAKSDDGNEIARGSRVEIVAIVKSTYYVKKKSPAEPVAGISPADPQLNPVKKY